MFCGGSIQNLKPVGDGRQLVADSRELYYIWRFFSRRPVADWKIGICRQAFTFTITRKYNKSISQVPAIAVIGTGIDSGKTTVTSFIIKTLSKYFDKINACKLAGTASQKDLYSYEDNGAFKT